MPIPDLRSIVYPRPSYDSRKIRQRFAGRWVVVTGATSGIGKALTQLLMEAGANLYLIARRGEVLQSLCEEAKQKGCMAHFCTADLREQSALDALVADMKEKLPCVDYFFCNAGKSIHRAIADATDRLHDYDRTMAVNYRSLVALTLAMLPLLQRSAQANGTGRVIYSSSVSTLYPPAPGWSAYHASKSAANVWCQTADAELAKTGVRVKVAYLPLVHTPMSAVNPDYKELPGYTAEEAALILLKLSQSRCLSYKPWWARLSYGLAHVLSPVIQLIYRHS